jgi:hypothetical protein
VEEAVAMMLYHYTAPFTSHLGAILSVGQINTTESNLSLEREHAGPDVVWLADSTDAPGQRWAEQPWEDGRPVKSLAVLAVELPAERVHHWPAWSVEHGIAPAIADGLAESGGDPGSWWVTTGAVTRWDIVGLTIAPFEGHDAREFDGDALRRLFQSAGARRALELPQGTKRQAIVNVPGGDA